MNNAALATIAWSFAKKYRTTILAWIVILAFGFLSYNIYLERQGFPAIQLPIAVVQGDYAADDPAQVDEDVVQQIGAALRDVEAVESFDATARANSFTLVVNFAEGFELDSGVEDVQGAISDQSSLPDDTSFSVQPIDPTKFNNSFNLIFSVYNQPDSSYSELQTIADKAAVNIATLSEVEAAETVPVIQQLDVPGTNQTVERQTSINYIGVRDGKELKFYPAIDVGVVGTDSADALELSAAVDSGLDDFAVSDDSSGANLKITADFAESISQQINSLEDNLISGLLAVVAVGWLLISWRAALVIALFIPTVLAATFIGLELGGQTLNTITLFSTILTLGLFVDDATIVAEAIDANRRGKNSREAVTAAIKRVGTASLAGTLTTILVFTPMLSVSGILGEFISLLPITVIVALSASFIVSMTLAPFLSRLLILPERDRQPLKLLDRLSLSPLITRGGAWLGRLPLLNRNGSRRGKVVTTLTVGLSLLFIAGGVFFAGRLPLSIFPESKDSNQLQANVDLSQQPQLANPQLQDSLAQKLNQQVAASIGDNLRSVSYQGISPRSLSLQLELSDYETRDTTSQQILEQLGRDVATIEGAEISFSQIDAGPPTEGFPFQMRVIGAQPELNQATTEIIEYIDGKQFEVNQQTVAVEEVQTNLDGAIRRSDQGQFRVISASFDNDELTSGSVVTLEEQVATEFDEQRLSQLGLSSDALNFDISLESQNADSFASIQLGLIAAIAGMYLLLVLLFNSLSQPLLILLAIPFSIFGVFGGLLLTDNPLSFFVMVGFLGLIGIVVNNSILLVEYANQERENGADRWQAISEAVTERFRPLLTTTLTTIVALLPLAWSDPFWQPLAYTLIFGMLSSTALIVISFPYYYLGLERIRDWKNDRFPNLR